MNSIQNALAFLERNEMSYSSVDIDSLLLDFLDDMQAGLDGNVKSLLMIPTYMNAYDAFPVNEPIIVIDAGGTNFRIAALYFDENLRPVIENFAKYPMPGSLEPIDKQAFLDQVVDYMEALLDKSDKVALCFSFPAEILESKDGKVISINKESIVHNSEGMILGESLNETLQRRGHRKKSFTVFNDSVAAMFSGFMKPCGKDYSSYIGLILGTGTNTCYIENGSEIKKIPNCKGKMAINMESGGFSSVKQGTFDRILDSQSKTPGDHIYEKMISGVYQGKLIHLILRAAADEKLFSEQFCSFISELDTLSMKEINEFCEYPFGGNPLAEACKGSESDRQTLYALIDANFERVARIMTVNIAAILLKINEGSDPTRPVCIVAEGSVFKYSKLFRKKLDSYIKTELNDKRNIYCDFADIEDATLIGSAIAGLVN